MYGYSTSPMPEDKIMRLFVIQAISSFVSKDYESGIHYLNEIKNAYAEYNSVLNPTLKTLAKEIIQAVDMFAPGAATSAISQTSDSYQNTTNSKKTQTQEYGEEPKSVASELQDLLNKRRAKRKDRET